MRTDSDSHDEVGEQRLRALFRASNPVYGVPVPPPRLSAPQLRALAEEQQRRTARLRRRGVIPLMAGAVIALLLLAGSLLPAVRRQPPPATPAQPAAPAPVAVPDPARAVPARPELLALVHRTLAGGETAVTGRYTYVRRQTWSSATTPPDAAGDRVVARDERLWWAPDRSGREIVTTLPGQQAAAPQADWVGDLPAGLGTTEVRDHPPGGLAIAVDGPSGDPAVLAGQLSGQQPFDNGPQAPLRAVADMYGYHFLDRTRRAAALRVLADTDGLLYRGAVTDRAGRPGIAVSIESDAGATTDLAVFDPDTGALLSYERLTRLAARLSPVREPVVMSYVLYLAHGRTDHLGGATR